MSNIINSLNRRSLVEYVSDAVLQSDGTYRCTCPFHDGATNPTSFAIFPENNSFYCFSCHAQGHGLISYVQHRDHCTYMQSVKTLCDDLGLTIDGDDSFNIHMDIVQRNEVWARTMHSNLSSVIDYLHKRGLSDETIEKYQYGYSPKMKALSIPMRDEFGRCVAFIYRFFEEGHCKYKNSKNIEGLFIKGETLYGLNESIKNLRETRTIYLCEGAFDAASATQQGLCCMAYCGISITRSHADKVAELLKPITGGKVVLVPDNDGKASKFVLRAREIFKKYHSKLVVKVAVIPDGNKDLNDMLVDGLDIATECQYENIDLYCAKQIVKAEDDTEIQEKLILEYMKSVSNPVVRADIASFLAEQWNRDVALVRELLSVKEDTTEEKLNDIVTIDKAYTALSMKKTEETFGLGYPNIDETIQFSRKNVFVLGAYSFSGKCLGEGSMVKTATGYKPIEQIIEGEPVVTLNESTGKLEYDNVGELIDTGIKEGFKVTTRTGRSVVVSKEHPFLTPNGWKRVDSGLSVKDQIALPMNLINEPVYDVSDRDITFVALMLADGSCASKGIAYSKKDSVMREKFIDICRSFNTNWTFEDDVTIRMTMPQTCGAREVLEKYGVMGCRSYEKKIPEQIMNTSLENIRKFIEVLWSGDGYIAYNECEYCSTSKTLAYQVQSLLLRFGILAVMRTKIPKCNGKECHRAYTVSVPKMYRIRFNELFHVSKEYDTTTLVVSDKHKRFGKIRFNKETAEGIMGNYDGNHKRVNEIVGKTYYPKVRCGLVSATFLKNKGLSKENLIKLHNDCHSPLLKYAVMDDVYFDDIVSIESVGNVHMYDIAMPKNHNFVANDILVHNTDNLIEFLLFWTIKLKKKTLFFSLEMPAEDIMKILVAKIVQIPRHKVKEYIAEHPDTYNLIMDKLMDYLYIIDKNSLTFKEMGDYVTLMRSRGTDIEVVAVDYFQYMKGVDSIEGQDNVAREMKKFAKENNVLLAMLSQLRKSSQSNEKDGRFHEPTQADLMGSGSIGNSADYIALIWRPALNSGLSPIDREKEKYTTMFKITKAREVRNGNTIFKLTYNPDTSRLSEVIDENFLKTD